METKSEWTGRLMKEIQREFEIKVAKQIFEDLEKTDLLEVDTRAERVIILQELKKKWTS